MIVRALILEGLAAGNWEAPRLGYDPMSPTSLFNLLGAKPGFQAQGDFRTVNAAMKKWLADNAGTFRVKKYVAAFTDR